MEQPQQTVIASDFYIDGEKFTPPKEWQDIEETIAYGQFSNQPLVDTQRFTFTGDAAARLYKHYKEGKILRGLDTSFLVTQRGITIDLFKDREIQLTDCDFIDPDFNNNFIPREVVASVKFKKGVTELQTRLDGITWGYLDSIGKVKPSDYTTVKTAVQKVYNGIDICLAIISLYVVQLQLQNLIDQTKRDIADFAQRVAGLTDAGLKVSSIIYISVILALRLASAIVLLASLVSTIVNIISILVPPIVKNKAITWRRGLEIIFDHLGYGFTGSFPELDQEVILPSKVAELSTNFLKNIIPTFEPNKKGYPSPSDVGYLASGFVGLARERFNARFDIIDDNVVMRWEGDSSLFLESSFTQRVDIARETVRPNIEQIPNTRLISFLEDISDEYTSLFYKGTSYEVVNQSENIPFKGVERHDIGLALGTSKTSTTGIEKLMISVAKVTDTLGGLLGRNPKLETRIKKNRINVLSVSTNNHSVAKLVPIIGGNMPRNHRDITSAKQIENKYYINRSILRGTGQKEIVPNFKTVFNLEDRESVIGNGNFVTNDGFNATIVNLSYREADDFAEGVIEIENDYIAKGDVEEIFHEPPL